MVNSNPLVAQSVEQLPFKEMVVGSIPTERTTWFKKSYKTRIKQPDRNRTLYEKFGFIDII